MANRNCITKKDFLKYEEVRKSKKYNMLFEEGLLATGLEPDVYIAIRTHYRELSQVANEQPNKEILLNHL